MIPRIFADLDRKLYFLSTGSRLYSFSVQLINMILSKVSHAYSSMFDYVFAFEQDEDPVVFKLYESTEEGKKVTRNNGEKFAAVFTRIADSKNSSYSHSEDMDIS